jgi:hypothetical protein
VLPAGPAPSTDTITDTREVPPFEVQYPRFEKRSGEIEKNASKYYHHVSEK